MSQKNIGKQFRDDLREYKSELDDVLLWSEIEDRVPKKKKKRVGFFWLFLGLALVLFVWKVIPETSNIVITSDVKSKDASQDLNSANNISQGNEIWNEMYKGKTKINESGTANDETTNEYDAKNGINTVKSQQSKAFNQFVINQSNDNLSKEQKEYTVAVKISKQLDADIESVEISKRGSKAILKAVSKLQTSNIKALLYQRELVSVSNRRIVKKKRVKPQKQKNSFVELSYLSGLPFDNFSSTNPDGEVVNYGKANFSQGLSFSYNRYLTTKFYGKVIFSADKIYKKYVDRISRDTFVETSAGEQIIKYNEYLNGVVDTESGIPIVKGVFHRDVVNLNSISNISIGLGLGMKQPIGRFNLNLEVEFQRTIFSDIYGLGREVSSNYINDLGSFDDYFSAQPRYTLNSAIKTEYAFTKSLSATFGIQYQMSMSSIVSNTTGNSEHIDLLRASFGLKKHL